MKKAFTLVEMLIVILIVWVLFVLLSKVYITSSKLYVYQKLTKNVDKDILFLNQTIQNLVDETEIDYERYTWSKALDDSLWFTSHLYLKDNQFQYDLFASWEQVFLTKSWTNINITTPLTNNKLTKIKKFKFKIIPFQDPYKIFWPNAMQPFTTVFMEIQNANYSTWSWETNIDYKIQESFNFKYFK